MERRSVLVAVALLGVLVSIFLGTLLTVTPVLRGFDAETYLRVQRPMTENVTPIVSAVGVLAALATGVAAWRLRRGGAAWRWPLLALGCLVAAGVSSAVVNVPINGQLQHWSATHPPSNWTATRDRWDEFHVVRTVLALVALACMVRLIRRREVG